MRRSAVLVVMLLALLWQSLAMARVGSTGNPLADLAHAVLHWQDEAHHHHEDGSFHFDDSKESVQHMAADHLSASLVLVAPPSHDFAPLGSAVPVGVHAAPLPNPTLDGLLRPPRAQA